jgi:hypothetical protein
MRESLAPCKALVLEEVVRQALVRQTCPRATYRLALQAAGSRQQAALQSNNSGLLGASDGARAGGSRPTSHTLFFQRQPFLLQSADSGDRKFRKLEVSGSGNSRCEN